MKTISKTELKRKQRVKQIVRDIDILHTLYGFDSDITLVVREKTNCFGIMNKGFIFYSIEGLNPLSKLCTQHNSLTVELLSDISKEIENAIR